MMNLETFHYILSAIAAMEQYKKIPTGEYYLVGGFSKTKERELYKIYCKYFPELIEKELIIEQKTHYTYIMVFTLTKKGNTLLKSLEKTLELTQ